MCAAPQARRSLRKCHTVLREVDTVFKDTGNWSQVSLTQDRQWRQSCPSQLNGHVYGVAQKFGTIILYALTLPNVNWFSQLFHGQNQEKIRNNTVTKDPTTPQVCRYTTLWKVMCLKSNNWKQDEFCNNIF